jgi:pimeloyl-ACP methyl ester carboxylesterase
MNDVGSVIPKASLDRIGQYVGREPSFDTFDELMAAMRSVSPFGELTDEQWRHLTVNVAKQDERGKWTFRYDPGIAQNFHATVTGDIDLRAFWNAVHGPALVIRGEQSDLLLDSTLREMSQRAHTQAYVVPNCGHAPMLMDDAQVGVIRRFLLG